MYQRPQHLLSRFAKSAQVHVWEEPLFRNCKIASLEISTAAEGVRILTPILPEDHREEALAVSAQRDLLDEYTSKAEFAEFIAWYYTPMALRFSDHLSPSVTVYDCMDELSGFQGAPPALVEEERRLFDKADVVFVGGASLFASKRAWHDNIHFFPSSVDQAHFALARTGPVDPDDQKTIPHPRVGFHGVIDERLDCQLVQDVCEQNPEWHFVLIGPVVKIREEDLPRANNLHYLGQKSYTELPSYLGNWDVAMLPFARNASTRYISPTKTPEYLAGGKPVVSTPIADVIRPYGELGLVRIVETADEFAEAIRQSLNKPEASWLARVDAFLGENSWDGTFESMRDEVQRCRASNELQREVELEAVEEGRCLTT